MRILVAPDCYSGTLTASQAAETLAAGWLDGAPGDAVATVPLSDGGPGFVEVLHHALGGELVPVTVPGPRGEPTPAALLVVPTPTGTVVHVESAHAVGLHLLPAERRDPTRTSSTGLGVLLRAALDLGARRVVVGLGGSATNDAGAGLLAGLGLTADVLAAGGGGLGAVTADDLAGLGALREQLRGVDLVVAADVDVPLLGMHGASAGFAAQKGATPEQAQELERALGAYAHVVGQVLAAEGPRAGRRELGLAEHPPTPPAQLPGAGAAGGLGFGLAVLGGRLLSGAQVVADAVGLTGRCAEADVVVTGEGTLDWQSLHGKVVTAVASAAQAHGVPVVAVPGQAMLGRREWSAAGLAGVYPVVDRPERLGDALADPAGTLRARAARVARTWSR